MALLRSQSFVDRFPLDMETQYGNTIRSELIQTCVHLSFSTLPLGFELEEAVSDYGVFRGFVKQLPPGYGSCVRIQQYVSGTDAIKVPIVSVWW